MTCYNLEKLFSVLIITCFHLIVFGQGCPNANFSANNFSNWQGFTGTYTNPGQTPGIVNGRHTIMNAPSIDPFSCGGLNVLPPGGTVSARLGNSGTGAQGERLRYQMTVDNTNALFIYKYAVVLENPSGHLPSEQPEFQARILNQAGAQIGGNCGVYTVYGGQPGQNFQTCGGVTWLPWTTVGVNLQPFIGQTIQVEFSTKDCSLSGHFGYAYVAAECMPLIIDVAYCEGSNNVILTAPPGFQTYNWSNGANTQSITVANPAVNATYSCTLTTFSNQGNCTVTVSTQVQPTIIEPGFTWSAVCEDSPMSFADTSWISTPNSPITGWNWDFGDGGVSNLETPNHTYANPGTYSVQLQVFTDDGCTDSVTKVINVYPKPVPTFNFQDVCLGTQNNFVNTTQDTLDLTFTWNLNNGLPMVNDTNTSYTYAAVGTYNVILYATNELGCSSFTINPVTVHGDPPVDAGPDLQVCPNTSVTLSGTGAVNYVWDNGVQDGVSFVPTASQMYHVTGTSATGCVSTDSVEILFFPTPPVEAGPDQEVCVGTAVTFTGSGANSYAWNNNVTDGQSFIPAVGNYTLVVTGTGANNCQATDTALLVVNAMPIVNAGPDQNICIGSSTVLTASGADQYVWNNGVYNGVPFVPGATATYTVTGTTNAGCQDVDDVTVTLEVPANPSFDATLREGCSPVDVVFSNTSTGTPYASCFWDIDDQTTDTLPTNIAHTYTEAGCYDVTLTLTTALGCVWESTISNFICVFPNPVAVFTPVPGVISELSPVSTMSNTSTGAVSYIWDFQDGTYSNETNPEHTFPVVPVQNHEVELIAVSEHGCTDTTTQLVVINEELIYYIPNAFTPDGDEYNNVFQPIFTSGFDPYDFNMLIFNRWGEVIFETNDAKVGWDGTYLGQHVKEGMYNYKITFKLSGSDARKIVTGHVSILK